MSFIHAFLSFMPWSIALLAFGVLAVKNRTTSIFTALHPSSLQKIDPAFLFVGIWSLSMPAFLLFTSQYTANYLAPIIPGLSLLLGPLILRRNQGWTLRSQSFVYTIVPVILGILGLILPVVGIVLGARWWILPVGSALGGVMYYLTLTLRSTTPVKSIISWAVLVTLLYTLVTLSLSTYISSRRSTGEVFTLLRNDTSPSRTTPIKVGFFGQPPFSSSVYSTVYQPRVGLEVVSSFDEGTIPPFEYYIASKKMSAALTPPSSIIEIARTRKWVLFKKLSYTPK